MQLEKLLIAMRQPHVLGRYREFDASFEKAIAAAQRLPTNQDGDFYHPGMDTSLLAALRKGPQDNSTRKAIEALMRKRERPEGRALSPIVVRHVTETLGALIREIRIKIKREELREEDGGFSIPNPWSKQQDRVEAIEGIKEDDAERKAGAPHDEEGLPPTPLRLADLAERFLSHQVLTMDPKTYEASGLFPHLVAVLEKGDRDNMAEVIALMTLAAVLEDVQTKFQDLDKALRSRRSPSP